MSARPAQPVPRLLHGASLADGEEVRAETRATKLIYFPGPIVALILFLGLDYASTASRYSWLPAVPSLTPFFGAIPAIGGVSGATYLLDLFLLLTLVILLVLLYRYYVWIRTVYAVTSSRVIIQQGVFARDFHEIPISQVRGIDVHQTFVQRLLGYGTLRLSSEGGARVGNEDWVGVPSPFNFQRVIETASQNISRGQAPPMANPEGPAYVRPIAQR
jgi:membrane protein YdbS with pleckstrin-like domain